jgi:hypothetical protein
MTMNSLRKQLCFGGRPFRLAVALLLASLSLAWPQAAARAAGTWSETGPLGTARYLHTATRLTDGRVLVAGGQDAGGALASAEIYNPAKQSWSVTGSLNVPRIWTTAVLLANGKVLVAGGVILQDVHDFPIDTAEVYTPDPSISVAPMFLLME